MSDAPEIPEATKPAEKRIALTIAIMAVILSVVNNLGDNSKTDAIIQTSKAADKWAFYQSKSIKEHLAELHTSLLSELGGATPGESVQKGLLASQQEKERQGSEKAKIQEEARDLEKQAEQKGNINDRCDLSALILQIGIVICSVAILSEWKPFWYTGIVLGVIGTALGVTAFLM